MNLKNSGISSSFGILCPRETPAGNCNLVYGNLAHSKGNKTSNFNHKRKKFTAISTQSTDNMAIQQHSKLAKAKTVHSPRSNHNREKSKVCR